ncbi:hypothetical protein QR685DRAFT_435289, partial [Neurospora intermedia]
LTFINRFRVYYNTRRLIIGIYQSLAGLSFGNSRTRNTDIFLLVLSPHTSNFDNIIKYLNRLIPLNQGIVIRKIYSRPTIVSAFTLYHTRDILQQN